MNIQVKQNQFTFLDHAKYYVGNLMHSAKNSALSIYPLAPLGLIGDIFLSSDHLCPTYYFFDTDYEDPEDEEYFISNDNEIDRFVSLYEKVNVKVIGGDSCENSLKTEFERKFKAKIANSVKVAISDSLKLIEEFNEKLNMSIQFRVGISSGANYYPYAAYGGTHTSPVIHMELPKLTFDFSELENMLKEVKNDENQNQEVDVDVESISLNERKFVIAHEISHLRNNDGLKGSLWAITTSAISCIPWVVNYSTCSSWGSYLATSCLESWTVKTISKFGYGFLSRTFEEKADLQALDLLKDNQGAVDFFRNHREMFMDTNYYHPSVDERLKYFQGWNQNKK